MKTIQLTHFLHFNDGGTHITNFSREKDFLNYQKACRKFNAARKVKTLMLSDVGFDIDGGLLPGYGSLHLINDINLEFGLSGFWSMYDQIVEESKEKV